MTSYEINYDEAFIIESIERYRSLRFRRFSRSAVKLICFIGLVFLMGVCLWAKIYPIALLFLFFIILLLLGPKFDYWLLKRRFRKSPFYNQKIHLNIGEQGLKAKSELSTQELRWAAFTRVEIFNDGFLVFSGPQYFHWWPDKAIIEGSKIDVESLLQNNIICA